MWKTQRSLEELLGHSWAPQERTLLQDNQAALGAYNPTAPETVKNTQNHASVRAAQDPDTSTWAVCIDAAPRK
jgi:hypothetical protein